MVGPQLRPVLVTDPQHHGPARRRGGDPQPRARGDGSAQRDARAVGLRPAALMCTHPYVWYVGGYPTPDCE